MIDSLTEKNPKPQKEVFLAVKWVTFKDAIKYLTEHGNMDVLRAARDYIKQ